MRNSFWGLKGWSVDTGGQKDRVDCTTDNDNYDDDNDGEEGGK